MNSVFRIVWCFIAVLITSCTEKPHGQMIDYSISDPFEKSFYSKNIRLMVYKDEEGFSDTTVFDPSGNRIDYSDRSHIKKNYNEGKLPTRYWFGGDLLEHYAVSYDSGANILVQTWTHIKTMGWDYRPEQLGPCHSYSNVFFFDEQHRIVKEVNQYYDVVFNYTYEMGLLTKKQEYDLRIHQVSHSWSYIYKNDQLRKVVEYYHGSNGDNPDEIHWFNDGRLDSTQFLRANGEVYTKGRYSYVYY